VRVAYLLWAIRCRHSTPAAAAEQILEPRSTFNMAEHTLITPDINEMNLSDNIDDLVAERDDDSTDYEELPPAKRQVCRMYTQETSQIGMVPQSSRITWPTRILQLSAI